MIHLNPNRKPLNLDQTEPVYPTAGACDKRRACSGPHTNQGEACPGCGVEFGHGHPTT